MENYKQSLVEYESSQGDIYAYDEVYRLKNIKFDSPVPTVPDTSQYTKQKSYQFDKVDNILKIVENTGGDPQETTEITNSLTGTNYQLNQYTRFNQWNLSYDQNGNTTQKGVQHFTYDYRNQLITARDVNSTIYYKYDPFGRRIETTNGTSITKYFYDGNQVIEEQNSANQPLKQYFYGNGIDELLRADHYVSGTPVSYYYHTDHLGSPTAITDSSGNLIERVTYDTYGMPTFTDASGNTIPSSLIGNSILFQGRRYDRETNLYYYRARYYDPIMGRFLQTDPMGYHDSLNLYQGMNMNVTNYVDPFGDRLFIYAGDQAKLKKIIGFLQQIARSYGTVSSVEVKNNSGYPQALIGTEEVVFKTNTPISQKTDIGAWLINELTSSNTKVYLLGIAPCYPSSYRTYTPFYRDAYPQSTVGRLKNLDHKSNSGQYLSGKSCADLPPNQVDSVVAFHDDIYQNAVQGNLEYVIDLKQSQNPSHSQNLLQRQAFPPGDFYFIVFHELMEAYYKVEKGLPYLDSASNFIVNNKKCGAHSLAKIMEEKWRGNLGLPQNITGSHVARKQTR